MAVILSIAIATYNSGRLLPKVLHAIERQTFPRNKLEIIIVDGGSTDSTLDVCKKHKCRVIVNPRTEPVYGKFLAYKAARGRYLMYLDHDEVLVNKRSLETRIRALETHKEARAVGGGNYKSPQNYPFVTKYINEFGDPFSFFIYRISKSYYFYFSSMKTKYPVSFENKNYGVFDLSNVSSLPITELVAGGAVFDVRTLKTEFPKTKDKIELLLHAFYVLNSKYPGLVVTKGDPILHYSSDTQKGYFKKLKWRAKNNIFFINVLGKSGFSGRQEYQSNFQNYKKYLFLPYAFSVVLPLIDSVYLSVTRRNLLYISHVYFTLYMAITIVFYSALKALGYKPELRNYDESKIVKG